MNRQLFTILLLFLTCTAIYAQKKGQARIDSLVAELAKTKTDTAKVKLLVSISYSSEYTDPPKSLQWGMQALDLAKKIRWKKGLFEANIQVGFVYGAMGNIEKADAHCSEGLEIAKDLQNDELLMKAYECMGLVSEWKSDYTKAIAYYYDCIRLAEKLKNKIYVANSYSNMASLYVNFGQHDKSVELLEKTVKFYKEMNDGEKTAITLLNLGIAYGALKKSDKSLECFLESLKIIEDFNRPFVVTKLLSSIGSIYIEKGDYQKALEYTNRSIEMSEKIKDPTGIAFGYAHTGIIYLGMATDTIHRDKEKRIFTNKEVLLNNAVDYLMKASTIANKLNAKSLEVSIWSKLSDAYQQLGDHRQALEAFKKAKVIADSSFSMEKQKQIANLEAKRENEVKQKEIEVLTEKNKRQRVMIASTLGGILLLGIIVAIVYILLKNKRRANALLEEKNAIIQSDLEEAKGYVLSLLPNKTNEDGISADWLFLPSSQLGGDAFGYHWIDKNHFSFYILDVCGHGVGPALHAVSILNVLNSRSRNTMDLKRPEEVVSSLNDTFQNTDHNGLFFSMWYGVYNRTDSKLTYVCAGHPPPMMIDDQGNTSELGHANIAVGWVSGYTYIPVTVDMKNNSRLVLFSDGVYEFESPGSSAILLSDFYEFLKKNLTKDLTGFHEKLKSQYQTTSFPDDYSMVTIGLGINEDSSI